jgi:Protein of unknown function (DUF1761)
MLSTIHWLPVIVSAIAVFAIGALWYSPMLFGKAWVKAHGHTQERIAAMRADMGRSYGVSFLCYVVMAATMAILIIRMEVIYVRGGVKLGALIGVGFAATIGLTANMYSEKRLAAWLIDAGYQIVYLMVMGAILVAWR